MSVSPETLKEEMKNLSLEGMTPIADASTAYSRVLDRVRDENGATPDGGPVSAPKPTREEDMARARAYDFPEQVPFDYATANVSANEALGLSWFSNAKVYEWNEDYGDVGPADPELEKELFHSQYHSEEGHQMSNLTYFTVEVEGAAEIEPVRRVSLPSSPPPAPNG
jgi:hypothetical protein